MMAFYLVRANPVEGEMDELREQLGRGAFVDLEPFGTALSESLHSARRRDGEALWEEEDYCSPPLAEERSAVLDDYFQDIRVKPVQRGEGWSRIADLPFLFPELADLRASAE